MEMLKRLAKVKGLEIGLYTEKRAEENSLLFEKFDQEIPDLIWLEPDDVDATYGNQFKKDFTKLSQKYSEIYVVCWNLIPNLANKLDFSHIIPIVNYDHTISKADEELIYLENYLADQLFSKKQEVERNRIQEQTFQLHQIYQYVRQHQNRS